MFQTACIPMLIAKASLKREMDDEEAYRVADLGIVIEPFTAELASELGSHIERHLFIGDDLNGIQMRPEVEDITVGLRVGLQRIIIESAPDAPSLATLKEVRVSDLAIVRKRKGDREWYRATLSARIDLRERQIREFLFHHFGEFRCFTFMDEQIGLSFDKAAAAPSSSTEATH